MKKLWDWLTDHIVITLIICSVVFALIVHCLYSMPAPNEWWKHKWGAGDILTYVSTVTLGLLAVWQNQRFKEENDKAQERLEKISLKANELNLISKIVENESQYITMLDQAYTELLDACGAENILIIMAGEFSDEKVSNALWKINQAIVHFLQIIASGYELQAYDAISLNRTCLEIAKIASGKLREYRKIREKAGPFTEEFIKLYTNTLLDKNRYIKRRRQTLNAILLEEMSLNEIRELYTRPEETTNGKNENGVN